MVNSFFTDAGTYQLHSTASLVTVSIHARIASEVKKKK